MSSTRAIMMALYSRGGKRRGHEETEPREYRITAEAAHALTREEAQAWVQAMTPKARWAREDVRPLAESRGMADKLDELWPVMCMLASDLGDVARAHGVDTPDFWADLARAWLHDKDAQPYKAYTYMHTIAGL